ncbi:hypothetical protein Tco_0578249 [Tanacetum coccineum]
MRDIEKDIMGPNDGMYNPSYPFGFLSTETCLIFTEIHSYLLTSPSRLLIFNTGQSAPVPPSTKTENALIEVYSQRLIQISVRTHSISNTCEASSSSQAVNARVLSHILVIFAKHAEDNYMYSSDED